MPTTRILILGQDVHTVDYSHPAIPPGMNAEKVLAGLDQAKASLEAQGHAVDLLQVLPDLAAAETAVVAQLTGRDYAVVVIGAGVRTRRRCCRGSRPC